MKQEKKHNKKYNYKKKNNKYDMVECCICFGSVENTSDNSILCGKKINFICGECKFRCNETAKASCPCCRSHPIKNPVARDIYLPLIQKFPKTNTLYYDLKISPKERRNFFRKNSQPFGTPFTSNTNRIVRARTNWTNRHIEYGTYDPMWWSNDRARHYNGFFWYNDSSSDSSDSSSDTASTLSLIEASDESEYEYGFDSDSEDELERWATEYLEMVMSGNE